MEKQRMAYKVFDRLYFLLNTDEFSKNEYLKRFEVQRKTLIRDKNYLALFYGVFFDYDPQKNKYIKNKEWNK